MSERGGKRAGSGRRHKLDFLTRLRIGGECERRFVAMWKQKMESAWQSRPGVAQLHHLQGQVRKSHAGSKEREAYSQQVERTVRAMRRTPAFVAETRRGFTKEARRPKDVTAKIVSDVAAEFAKQLGRQDVGPRYARRCWDEFRAFQRDTAEDV